MVVVVVVFSFPFGIPVVSFSCSMVLVKTSRTIMKIMVKVDMLIWFYLNGHASIFFSFNEAGYEFAVILLTYIPCIPKLVKLLFF